MEITWRQIIVSVMGGAAGYAYYRYFGCHTASGWRSNPLLISGLGALLALLLIGGRRSAMP
jgi:hypothetical protein